MPDEYVGGPVELNGRIFQRSTPPSASTVSSPSDSPEIVRSISSSRVPVVVSTDQTRNAVPLWLATSRRSPTNVAPVIPPGGTAPASRLTGRSFGPLGAAFAGLISASSYAIRSEPADVQTSGPS